MTTMDPAFGAALRTELVTRVDRSRRPRRLLVWAAGLTVVGVAGGGVAFATGVLPLPGATRPTAVSRAVEGSGTGPGGVDLGPAPLAATHAHVDLTCLDSGMFSFPDGAGLSCGAGDVGATASYSVPVAGADEFLRIGAPDGARWAVLAYWTHEESTAWGVNASGETYGVTNDRGTPDLLAVVATNGEPGYVRSRDLAAANDVSNPQEALERQAEGSGFTLPVLEADGRTQVGEFVVGTP